MWHGFGSRPAPARQWPEVYDSWHTFLHVARVRKHTDMRELHAFCVQFSCNSRMSVYFLTRTTCKNVRQNLILRATAYFPQLWQQGDETPCSSLAILRDFEPLSALIRALLYCFALYNFLLLGFRQWRSRADRVSALDINVWLPLFWSTWIRARGQDSATCVGLANGRDHSDCRQNYIWQQNKCARAVACV